jgi:hypothetical protein
VLVNCQLGGRGDEDQPRFTLIFAKAVYATSGSNRVGGSEARGVERALIQIYTGFVYRGPDLLREIVAGWNRS